MGRIASFFSGILGIGSKRAERKYDYAGYLTGHAYFGDSQEGAAGAREEVKVERAE